MENPFSEGKYTEDSIVTDAGYLKDDQKQQIYQRKQGTKMNDLPLRETIVPNTSHQATIEKLHLKEQENANASLAPLVQPSALASHKQDLHHVSGVKPSSFGGVHSNPNIFEQSQSDEPRVVRFHNVRPEFFKSNVGPKENDATSDDFSKTTKRMIDEQVKPQVAKAQEFIQEKVESAKEQFEDVMNKPAVKSVRRSIGKFTNRRSPKVEKENISHRLRRYKNSLIETWEGSEPIIKQKANDFTQMIRDRHMQVPALATATIVVLLLSIAFVYLVAFPSDSQLHQFEQGGGPWRGPQEQVRGGPWRGPQEQMRGGPWRGPQEQMRGGPWRGPQEHSHDGDFGNSDRTQNVPRPNLLDKIRGEYNDLNDRLNDAIDEMKKRFSGEAELTRDQARMQDSRSRGNWRKHEGKFDSFTETVPDLTHRSTLKNLQDTTVSGVNTLKQKFQDGMQKLRSSNVGQRMGLGTASDQAMDAFQLDDQLHGGGGGWDHKSRSSQRFQNEQFQDDPDAPPHWHTQPDAVKQKPIQEGHMHTHPEVTQKPIQERQSQHWQQDQQFQPQQQKDWQESPDQSNVFQANEPGTPHMHTMERVQQEPQPASVDWSKQAPVDWSQEQQRQQTQRQQQESQQRSDEQIRQQQRDADLRRQQQDQQVNDQQRQQQLNDQQRQQQQVDQQQHQHIHHHHHLPPHHHHVLHHHHHQQQPQQQQADQLHQQTQRQQQESQQRSDEQIRQQQRDADLRRQQQDQQVNDQQRQQQVNDQQRQRQQSTDQQRQQQEADQQRQQQEADQQRQQQEADQQRQQQQADQQQKQEADQQRQQEQVDQRQQQQAEQQHKQEIDQQRQQEHVEQQRQQQVDEQRRQQDLQQQQQQEEQRRQLDHQREVEQQQQQQQQTNQQKQQEQQSSDLRQQQADQQHRQHLDEQRRLEEQQRQMQRSQQQQQEQQAEQQRRQQIDEQNRLQEQQRQAEQAQSQQQHEAQAHQNPPVTTDSPPVQPSSTPLVEARA